MNRIALHEEFARWGLSWRMGRQWFKHLHRQGFVGVRQHENNDIIFYIKLIQGMVIARATFKIS